MSGTDQFHRFLSESPLTGKTKKILQMDDKEQKWWENPVQICPNSGKPCKHCQEGFCH